MESKVCACPLLCERQTGVPWAQGVLQPLCSPRGSSGSRQGWGCPGQGWGLRPRSRAPRGLQGALPARETRPGRRAGRGSGGAGVPQPVGTWCCERLPASEPASAVCGPALLMELFCTMQKRSLHPPRWWCGGGLSGTGALRVLLAFWKFVAKLTRR